MASFRFILHPSVFLLCCALALSANAQQYPNRPVRIVATLVLMVMEKHKDIAILVSMGASRRSILALFMLQGTIIGAIGTFIGAVFGFVACRILDHYKLIQMPADVYQISHLPFKLLPVDAALVVVGAMLICFLATIHPARNAARLDPAEALRRQ